MGGAALCHRSDRKAAFGMAGGLASALQGDIGLPASSQFGASFSIGSSRRWNPIVVVPGVAAASAQKAGRQRAGSVAAVGLSASASAQLTWQLIEELIGSLQVQESGGRALDAAVRMELKGALLGGTTIMLHRQGCRVRVEIAPGSTACHRAFSNELPALRSALAEALPGCDLEMKLTP
jgi:hypothetical protein